MLILSRRLQQQIVINNNIVITVVRIKGGRVQLGVKAPKEVTVVRKELLDRN
jgi:carbon storage regulator